MTPTFLVFNSASVGRWPTLLPCSDEYALAGTYPVHTQTGFARHHPIYQRFIRGYQRHRRPMPQTQNSGTEPYLREQNIVCAVPLPATYPDGNISPHRRLAWPAPHSVTGPLMPCWICNPQYLCCATIYWHSAPLPVGLSNQVGLINVEFRDGSFGMFHIARGSHRPLVCCHSIDGDALLNIVA